MAALQRPCKIRYLPLDCHCNSGVNSRYRKGNAHSPAAGVILVLRAKAAVEREVGAGELERVR